MPATPRYILRYPDPSDPAGFTGVGDQPIHLRSLAEDTEGTVGGVEDILDAHLASPHGGVHPDLPAHNTLGLATQAELDAHAATAHGGVHPDLPAHNTLGLATQAELDQAPVMRFATANGVFAVASGTSIYMVPDATWALPDTTNDPDGTLIYRAA